MGLFVGVEIALGEVEGRGVGGGGRGWWSQISKIIYPVICLSWTVRPFEEFLTIQRIRIQPD